MKTFTLQYFSLLRDEAGKDKEEITSSASNAQELYQEMRQLYNFSQDGSTYRVAINDEFVAWDTILNDGDNVVFIPPVAGG
jgi:sulfur-carrier protein